MNKEALRQLTIKAWKEDCADHDRWDAAGYVVPNYPFDYRGLKVDSFECYNKITNAEGAFDIKGIQCILKFKDSRKEYWLRVDPSVSNYNELITK